MHMLSPIATLSYEEREDSGLERTREAARQAFAKRWEGDRGSRSPVRRRWRGGQGTLAVKADAAETFWQRFLATYRFRRRFGREIWWASFRGAIRAAWHPQ